MRVQTAPAIDEEVPAAAWTSLCKKTSPIVPWILSAVPNGGGVELVFADFGAEGRFSMLILRSIEIKSRCSQPSRSKSLFSSSNPAL
jgi:hypothetical protein